MKNVYYNISIDNAVTYVYKWKKLYDLEIKKYPDMEDEINSIEWEQLCSKLETLIEEYKKIINDIKDFEIDPDDYKDAYKEFIDETHPLIVVRSIRFDPSRVLEELDPIAFQLGINEYIECLDKETISEWVDLIDTKNIIEFELESVMNDLLNLFPSDFLNKYKLQFSDLETTESTSIFEIGFEPYYVLTPFVGEDYD